MVGDLGRITPTCGFVAINPRGVNTNTLRPIVSVVCGDIIGSPKQPVERVMNVHVYGAGGHSPYVQICMEGGWESEDCDQAKGPYRSSACLVT